MMDTFQIHSYMNSVHITKFKVIYDAMLLALVVYNLQSVFTVIIFQANVTESINYYGKISWQDMKEF